MIPVWRDVTHHIFSRVTRLVLAGGLALLALADTPARAGVDVGADAARLFVCGFTDRAIAVMANGTLAETGRTQQLRDILVASFDLPGIGRAALGRYWRIASTDQRAQFLDLFERQQVLVFAGRFAYISRHKMTIEPAATDAVRGWLVPSEVERAASRPIPVDWMVVRSASGWRVVDLAIDGASMDFLLHEDFGAVLLSNGGNFDALFAAMRQKIAQLSAG
jgi:phospholipid transport system substrate-binding protein